MIAMASCEKGEEQAIIPDASTFKLMAEQFVEQAGLPVDFETAITENEITDLQLTACKIVEEWVVIETDVNGNVGYQKVKNLDAMSESRKAEAVQEMIDHGLIASGDYVFRTGWSLPDGEMFHTLGVISADGKPKFEPILHFNGILVEDDPRPGQRDESLIYNRKIYNGFRLAVEVEWKAEIETGQDPCQIRQDKTKVELLKSETYEMGWDQKTLLGQRYECKPKEDCTCRFGSTEPAEECLEIIAVTYVAMNLSDLKIEEETVEYKGFTLDKKVTIIPSIIGEGKTYDTIKSICATGS